MLSPVDFEKKLTSFLKQKPFEPFVIERDNGERFLVEKPSALMYQGGSSCVYFHADGNIDFIDAAGVERFLLMNLTPLP